MLRFEQTSHELAELSTIRSRAYGEHTQNSARSGLSGDILYREEFDPDIHEEEHIEPGSLEEDLFEVPHVKIVNPIRPMSINVIVHQPSAEGLEEVLNYGEQRRDFTRMIGRAIGSSIPGITDSVTLYAVGKEANEAKKDFVVVSNNGDQQDELDEIEDITRSGLTFIVSDFLKLDPGLIRANNKIIAVKANIPEDLELKARPLVIRSGVNGGEIDLSSESDLERVNRALIVNDLRIQNALRVSGIAVASVVQDRQSNYGINRQLADRAIANSVKETRLKIKH